ncbi:MAG TPA: hypothetical protein VJQ25_11025 [Nitrospira sp.]|nr:hypothetical protein [Nitrospira sp.]
MRLTDWFLSASFLAMTVAGCSFILPPTNSLVTSERQCSSSLPRTFHAQDTQSTAGDYTGISFSDRTVEIAKIIDALPVLSRLDALQQSSETHNLQFFELRQSLSDRLLLTMFEVSSAVAEIVCERDRADQAADRMEEFDATLVKRLTLVSIVIGGVASVVSGGIGLAGGASTASDAAEIGSGVLASLFGGTALFAGSKQDFRHERNLLKEVWNHPRQSSIFSPAVWRFLQWKYENHTSTGIDEVINAWRQQGRLGEPGSSGEKDRIDLFFGTGGAYSATDLRARASMLETLEAHIQLMSEELELFVREIIQPRM